MKKQKRATLVAVLLIVLLMGIGYAAISTVTLTINGNAVATADANNFTPHFTEVKSTVSDPTSATVTAAVNNTDNTKATMDVEGLTKEGDSATAIFEIINESNGVDASSIDVKANGITVGNSNYFDVTTEMCTSAGASITDYSVASGEKTYAKVTVSVKKTPVTADQTTTFEVLIDAVPAN